MKKEINERQANFELLRILSMLMVICIHFAIHGGIFETLERTSANYAFTVAVKNISTISVDCFILLTGYFLCQSRFRFERVAGIYFQTLYYSLFFMIICFFVPLSPETPMPEIVVKSLFPVCTMRYWFVSSYLLLLLLSPFFNTVIADMTRQRFLLLLGIFFFAFSFLPMIDLDIFAANKMAKPMLFVSLYFMGAYCRIYVNISTGKWKKYLGIYLGVGLLSFILLGANIYCKKNFGIRPFACEDFLFPTTLAAAVSFFLFIGSIRIPEGRISNLIIKASPLAFGVYLFHENPYFCKYLWKELFHLSDFFKSTSYPVLCIVMIAITYIAGSVFDLIRVKFFELLGVRERISGSFLTRKMNALFPETGLTNNRICRNEHTQWIKSRNQCRQTSLEKK
ncbi:MAG: acyltransferase [Victivallaceae bacterium]|nr:acyltransferase [Victivallaceae bacterium]